MYLLNIKQIIYYIAIKHSPIEPSMYLGGPDQHNAVPVLMNPAARTLLFLAM